MKTLLHRESGGKDTEHALLALANIGRLLTGTMALSILVILVLPLPVLAEAIAWGGPEELTAIPIGLTNATAVSAGRTHNLALLNDGTVVAWGSSRDGLTNVPTDLRAVISISAGGSHSLVLTSNRTLVAWGRNEYDQCTVPPTATNIVAISAGAWHSLALRADGTVVAFGNNEDSQCEVPWGTPLTAIAAGGGHSLGLNADGTVVAWGRNGYGQTSVPPEATNIVAIAAGANHNLLLRRDGSVVAFGDNSYGQCTVPDGLSGVVAVSAGTTCSLALGADGTLVSWGSQQFTNTPPPVSNAVQIAAGDTCSLALLSDGRPYVLREPLDQDSVADAHVVLSAKILASPSSYQWQWFKDDTALLGGQFDGDTVTLPFDGLRPEDAGRYWLVAENPLGATTSRVARVTVRMAPRMLFHPESQNVALESTIQLSIYAQGLDPLSFQWFKDGKLLTADSRITGARTALLKLERAEYLDGGAYWGVASDARGYATSEVATVTVSRAVGWGENWSGQLDPPQDLTDVTMVAAGYLHCLGLKRDGTVIAWGGNPFGQTDVPPGLSNVVSIAAGGRHSLALKADGTVVGWGKDPAGTLLVPSSLSNVTAIAAGVAHCVALLQDGSVVVWGYKTNYWGSRVKPMDPNEVPADATEVVAIAAGGSGTAALRANGTVVTWGSGDRQPPLDLRNVVGVAVGGSHGLVLRSDGTVVAWGNNRLGQCNVPTGLSNVVAISAGTSFSLALKDDGTVVAWGRNTSGQCDLPSGLSNVVAISAGSTCAWALKGDGRPFIVKGPVCQKAALGQTVRLTAQVNGLEPMGYRWFCNGTPLSDDRRRTGSQTPALVIQNARFDDTGYYHLVADNGLGTAVSSQARLSVSQAVGWGDSMSYQADVPMDTQNIVAVAAGDSHSLALSADGGVSGWGDDSQDQITIPLEATNITAIAAGAFHNLALCSDGKVLAWGHGKSGQCNVPTDLANVVAISAGGAHSLALQADGTVVSWGRPPTGTLQFGAVAAVAGKSHSLALRTNGTVVAWGRNKEGQCNIPPGLSNVVAIAAGAWHNLALRADGTVVAWGYNRTGACDVPASLSNVVAISAGSYHSVAVQGDGRVVAWGRNVSGQCESPAGLANVTAVAAGRIHTVALLDDEPLAHALGGSGLAWQTFGNAPWMARPAIKRDGQQGTVAGSGVIAAQQESGLETSVTGPGTLGFWWKVSSEDQRDWLEFYLNGSLADRTSGTSPWSHKTFPVNAGTVVARWRYVKDAMTDAGADVAWLDAVSFTPAEPPHLSADLTLEGRVVMQFPTLAGFKYVLQSTPDLDSSPPSWTGMSTNIGTGQPFFFLDSAPEDPILFYRVILE